MAEYKYVDWPGLQYYHGKVTELIDSRLRDCIKFGGEVLFENLDSPDTPDLNIVYRVLNSFTVRPSNEWFDESTWNNTYPSGTLLQVVQDTNGVVYKVFMQPSINGGGGSDVDVDLSNYYTIAEVDAKIVDALEPYATKESVTVKLDAIQSLLDTHIDEFGKLSARVTDVEETLETRIGPAITQLEQTVVTLAETKANIDDIPSLEGYATEEFVATAIAAIEIPDNVSAFVNDAGYLTEHQDLSEYAKLTDIPDISNLATKTFVTQKIAEAQLSGGEVDLSAFYTKDEIDAKGFATEEYVQQQLDEADVVGMDARITVLETNTTTVTGRVDAVEDQAEANEAAITALSGEIDRVDETLLNMDTQIINISQNLADLQAYGTF